MKLSIIVPVYNAEKYLDKCLKSVVNQTLDLHDIEVLLVDDGSTDLSLQIAESYQNVIPNLTIFTQENGGESAARNTALKAVQGEFITFLDNDDYYEKNTLQTALEFMNEKNLDILYLRLRQVDEEGNFLRFGFDLENECGVSSGLTYERRPYPATVYRRKIITDIIFPKNILVGTDSVFNALVQSQAIRVSFTKKALYNYTYRPNSLSTKGFTNEAFNGFIKAIKIISNFKKEKFPKEDLVAETYFGNIIEVFIRRIIDWNILPSLNKKNYLVMYKTLQEEGYTSILKKLSVDYRYIDISFEKFAIHQKILQVKTKIHKLIVNKKK